MPDQEINQQEWEALRPVYFPRWAWEKARRHNPQKYTMRFPVYQGQKVILT